MVCGSLDGRGLSCWELWGAASRWRPTHSGRQTPPTWGLMSLPVMSQLPVMSSLIGTSWLCSSSQSERVTQTGPGEVKSDRRLIQAPGQRAGWAGLGGGAGVSGFSPGWMAIFDVGCSTYWRRQWHPTPVPLPGKSLGRRSLGGCSPWGG